MNRVVPSGTPTLVVAGSASPARGIRIRQIMQMALPTARTIRWTVLLGGIAAAEAVLWFARHQLSAGDTIPLMPIRVAAVLLCLGAGFVIDDEAGITVEPAVIGLSLRRGLRLAMTVPVVGLGWAAALWTASALAAAPPGGAGRSVPVGALTLEAAALLGVTLGAAAVATRWLGHGRGGVAAGPALLAFVMAMVTLAPYWPLFLDSPAAPGWAAAHVRWGLTLAGAVLVLVGYSLDPARRSGILRRGTRSMSPAPLR